MHCQFDTIEYYNQVEEEEAGRAATEVAMKQMIMLANVHPKNT